TAGDKEKANAMTAGWGGMGVIWGKNVVFVFVRESRYTRELMDKYDTFSVNFLGDNKKSIRT
ncbi:MAG: flavin reductase family protein, partial [Lachnospiraceae bacterium]|nr:flavin reductase family protein [Lachnospiraceae bacterium]